MLSLSEWLKLKQHEFVNILHQSRYDPLTKVGNRLLLNDHLLELSGSYIIVFIDCDGVKTINDQLGHAKGDEFLVSTAQLMQSALSNKGDVYRNQAAMSLSGYAK
ncbi:GGDEF domain-containing protein [Pseudoalteromonas espejiana]